jgi:hypothetical protein
MTAQHTPGPWRYLPGDGLAWRPSVQRATEGGFVVVGLSRDREEADAKLIAAAPDLLTELRKARAALKEQLEILIQSHTCPTTGLITDDTALLVIESDQDLINSIDAAIAKATEAA